MWLTDLGGGMMVNDGGSAGFTLSNLSGCFILVPIIICVCCKSHKKKTTPQSQCPSFHDAFQLKSLYLLQNTGKLPFTFFTSWYIATPCEIPLAHEDLRAGQLISGVALVGDHGAVDEIGVGCALPAIGDLGQLRASVVPRHLFGRWNGWHGKRGESGGCT